MKKFLFLALLFIGCENPAETADCAGVVGGNAVKDTCGVCNGDGTSCIDCANVPNGDSVLDDCGVCDSNSSNDCKNCSTYFKSDQSMLQAFYNIYSVTIDGTPVDSDDWVGSFNGEVCVGALKWDISLCNNEVCSIPAMGDDGTDLTAGYMSSGDIPTFKIYDVSAGVIYNTTYIEDIPAWQNFGQSLLSTAPLEAVITSAAPCQ